MKNVFNKSCLFVLLIFPLSSSYSFPIQKEKINHGGQFDFSYDQNSNFSCCGLQERPLAVRLIHDLRVQKKTSSVSLFFRPMIRKIFGENNQGLSTGDQNHLSKKDHFSIYQLHGKFNFGQSEFIIGRHALSFGRGIFLSNNLREENPAHFDGLLFKKTFTNNSILSTWFDFINNQTSPNLGGFREYFLGLNFENRFSQYKSNFFLYSLIQSEPFSKLKSHEAHGKRFVPQLGHSGNLEIKDKKIKLWLDLAIQRAMYNKIDAATNEFILDFKIDYAFKIAKENFSTGLNPFYASKNFYDYYPDIYQSIGVMNLFGRKNLHGIEANTKYNINDQYALKLNGLYVKRSDKNEGLTDQHGLDHFPRQIINSNEVGQEIDLIFIADLKENGQFTFEFGVFFPGKYFKEADIEDNIYGSKVYYVYHY